MKRISLIASAVFVLMFMFVFMSTVQAQSPQETLSQYISDLQRNPNDYALREKIIKHVQSMRPAPAISEEAKRYMARGKAASKGAKEVKDFNEAADEFKKALLAAPWIAEGYYNLGIVQDKAGQYAAAMESLKLYIMSAPNASDVEKVKEMVYEIEYRKEKAAKESSPEAITEKKQKTYEQWLRNLDGAIYVGQSNVRRDLVYDNELVIRGTLLIWRQRVTYYGPNVVQEVPLGQWYDMAEWGGRMQIIGRQAKRIIPGFGIVPDIFTISEDGNSITQVQQGSNGGTFTFYRQ